MKPALALLGGMDDCQKAEYHSHPPEVVGVRWEVKWDEGNAPFSLINK
jgi:hypothetical protein